MNWFVTDQPSIWSQRAGTASLFMSPSPFHSSCKLCLCVTTIVYFEIFLISRALLSVWFTAKSNKYIVLFMMCDCACGCVLILIQLHTVCFHVWCCRKGCIERQREIHNFLLAQFGFQTAQRQLDSNCAKQQIWTNQVKKKRKKKKKMRAKSFSFRKFNKTNKKNEEKNCLFI